MGVLAEAEDILEELGVPFEASASEATVGERAIFRARQTLVWREMEGEAMRSAPVPGDLRARLSACLVP